MASRLLAQRHIGYRRDTYRRGIHSRPQSQGVLPAAIVDRPGLSAMRTCPRQWHGDRCSIPEGKEQEKEEEGRSDEAGCARQRLNAVRRLISIVAAEFRRAP